MIPRFYISPFPKQTVWHTSMNTRGVGGYSGFQVTGMIVGFFGGLKNSGIYFWVGKFGKGFFM